MVNLKEEYTALRTEKLEVLNLQMRALRARRRAVIREARRLIEEETGLTPEELVEVVASCAARAGAPHLMFKEMLR